MRYNPRTPWLCAATLSCMLAAACAVNPATGKREFTLVSERQEIEMGRAYDQQVVASMGLYDDEALQQYVQRLGSRMAALSERPELDWTFRVVDDPSVNAFALPGGYIYITRGIMAHLNSEAELASVIGHEIGHVTARHSASQISRAQLAQVGLGLGMVFGGDLAQSLGGLAEQSVGLLFLKFSRDDERQADDLGLRYLLAAGYDPRPMPDVFEVLRRVGESGEGGRLPGWLSTHPAPENRQARLTEAITAMSRDFSGRTVDQPGYYARIDNVAFGANPREGFFKETVFYHPDMRFRFEFPAGWQTRNERQAVMALSPGEDALVQISLAAESTPTQALQAFLGADGTSGGAAWVDRIAGSPAASREFSATTQQGTLRGLVAFLEHDGKVFRLLGFTPDAKWSGYREPFRRALASFDRVTDPAVLSVAPARLKIVEAPGALTLPQLADRFAATAPLGTLALINHLEESDRLQSGRPYKVVVGGRLP